MMKPYYDRNGITLYLGDCREVLPQITEQMELLLTDPPYGIKADKDNAHSSIRDNPLWAESKWDYERQTEGITLSLKMTRAAAVWGGNYYTDVLPVSSGWLGWLKPQASTGFSLADMELCWTSLPIAARTKMFPRRDGHFHPTQKPVAVMSWCLSFFPDANTILDPFLGSGTTSVCAKKLGRRCIGIEINEDYLKIAIERLRQDVLF